MHYSFQFPNRSSRYADITVHIEQIDSDSIEFKLPVWRPGRYELGNFAKNIRNMRIQGPRGQELGFKKISGHAWQVNTTGCSSITVHYSYYCSQPDAGACWLDEQLVYINPVHCCIYMPERLHESCSVELKLPPDYKVACSLPMDPVGLLLADDYHQLVDSPWMAASEFNHATYKAGGTLFHVWIHGDIEADLIRIINDFKAFSQVQIDTMGGLPVDEFHFLVLALPYRFYHGVEHLWSTVLALGPAHEMMQSPLYDDLTGVASHELFHVWNVKCIRPADLLPYDYSSENHSRLGYVYEGVTTYYGDLFLVRSGVYSVEQYFSELDLRLKKHYDSHGRFHSSLADSSFDTWLDGYVPGAPHRKTSIYDEGSIVALMTDLFIRKSSSDNYSLDDVMRSLYEDFGKKNLGYAESDYCSLVEHFAGCDMKGFFSDFVHGTAEYEPLLRELLGHVGCRLIRIKSSLNHERRFGFRVIKDGVRHKVVSVLPGSPADTAGLAKDDELVAVNGEEPESDLTSYFTQDGRSEQLTVQTPMKRIREIKLQEDGGSYFYEYHIARSDDSDELQNASFRSWTCRE
ncbi:MAG: M61 family metallopeptidase [Bacteroidota bacterium]